MSTRTRTTVTKMRANKEQLAVMAVCINSAAAQADVNLTRVINTYLRTFSTQSVRVATDNAMQIARKESAFERAALLCEKADKLQKIHLQQSKQQRQLASLTDEQLLNELKRRGIGF